MSNSEIETSAKISWFGRFVRRPESISPNNALLWGVAGLIVASMAGWYFRVLPTSAFGLQLSDYIPLVWHVVLNATMWITFTLPMYILLVLTFGRVNIVEVFGRVLFAHWPVTLLFLLPIFGDRVAFATFSEDMMLGFKLYTSESVIYFVVMVIVAVWWIVWSYRAMREASRSVTDHVGWIFTTGMILGLVLCRTTMSYMIDAIC